MADWTPPPPGAWVPPGGFTPIPGMAPNPKLPLEVQGAGLDNATKALNLKYAPALKQAAVDNARAAMTTASTKQQELANQLSLQKQAQQAILNQEYSLAQQAAQADDIVKASNHPVFGNTATGGWNDVMKRVPFSGGSNANALTHMMENLQLGLSALGAQDRKQVGGPGGGTQFSVRNLQEFKSMGAAGGPLQADTKASVVHDNLIRAQNVLRNDMALQMGLDPTKVDVRAIPGPAFEPSPQGRAALQNWMAQRQRGSQGNASASPDVDAILRKHGVIP